MLHLRQAQALALMQNPTLAAFGWEVRAGEARTLQAGLLPNPEAHAEIENVAGSGELQGFEGTEITIGLSQMIELAGKRSKRIRVAALERDLAAWEYEMARVDVLTQVTQAFIEVLSAQARLAVDEELMHLADQVLAVVAERVKAGKVSPVEETKARVASSTRRIALERAQRALAATRARLSALWGSTTPSFERAEGSLDFITAIPSLEQLTQRIGQNPDIARWVTVIAQRQAAVHLAEAQRIPDPTLGGGFRYSNETHDNALVMEVALPLPVFDRHQGKILETRYQLAKATEERRAVQAHVSAALQEAYAALATAFGDATALQNEVVPGAQHAFGAASEGFRQGKFSFLEVLDAQRTLFEARVQYIEALAAYHKAIADVERLIGEPLATVTHASPQP
jgi:cobalt-zinc-cadmium efflux system outer membrane protein